MAHDPRWPMHLRLGGRQARSLALFDNEMAAIAALPRKGRGTHAIAGAPPRGGQPRAAGAETVPASVDPAWHSNIAATENEHRRNKALVKRGVTAHSAAESGRVETADVWQLAG